MEPLSQNRGGLIGQLRDYALRGSDDGSWNEPIAQKSIRSHSTNIRGAESDFIKVELEAKKVWRDLGMTGVNTFYSLRATYIERGLILECLPRHVLEELRKEKVKVGEEQEVAMIVIDNDEIDKHEFDGYDDMIFRRVRGLEFMLNGKGSLLYSAREDFYEDDDANGGVDIVGARTEQLGSLKLEEKPTVTLEGWGKNSLDDYSTELLLHPDLRKMEVKTGIKELREDLSFLDIVKQYTVNKQLLRDSQLEQRQTMLTLLAFLNYSVSTKDIKDLLE